MLAAVRVPAGATERLEAPTQPSTGVPFNLPVNVRGPVLRQRGASERRSLAFLDRDDRKRLAHVVLGAPGSFHRDVEAGEDQDRICGTTPMFLTAMLAGGKAELLHYGQAWPDDRGQVVTFASLGYA